MKQNDRASWISLSQRGLTPLPEPNVRRTPTRLLVLGAAVVMLLLSGCASARIQRDPDPWKYNYNTGFPAVGGPRWDF